MAKPRHTPEQLAIRKRINTLFEEGLSALNLEGQHLSDLEIPYFANALRRSSVRSLNLSKNALSDAGLIDLFKMLPESGIEHLYLSSMRSAMDINSLYYDVFPGDESVKILGNLLPLTKLSVLDLSDFRMTTNGALYLAKGMITSSLEELSLNHTQISRKGLEALLISAELCGLKILSIKESVIPHTLRPQFDQKAPEGLVLIWD